MLLILLLAIWRIRFAEAFNDFPSLMIANASMAIVIERPFFEVKAVQRRRTNAYERKLEGFLKSVKEAAKAGAKGGGVGIELSVFQDTSIALDRDFSVLLSVASCDKTWSLFDRARREKIVHLAITDRGCPRLPIAEGLSVPIVEPGSELAQMFLDIRIDGVLSWGRINFLHDGVFEKDTISRTLRALCGEIPNMPQFRLSSRRLFSTTKLTNDSRPALKRAIIETLTSLPPRAIKEDRFLVIVSNTAVPLIIECARSLGMLHPRSQWLFILPDSGYDVPHTTSFHKLLGEGENIAFIYNDTNYEQDCQVGLVCHAKEMVASLGASVESALRQEIDLHQRVTEEEFEAVRMTKAERAEHIINYIREDLMSSRSHNEGRKRCDDCIIWRMLAGITWGNTFEHNKNDNDSHELLDVGYWTPGQGAAPKDFLFPHTKQGFRTKKLPIVTYDNPPWQYLTKSADTGKRKWDGLVFDIIDELSRKLNFTYKLVEMELTSALGSKNDNARRSGNRFDERFDEKEFIRAATASGESIPDAVTEMVHSGKVLMSACAATTTENLRWPINFTFPISVQIYGILARRPKALSKAMLFASPYTPAAWACLAGSLLLVGPILYLVHRYSPARLEDGRPLSVGLSSPARCLWYIYGALLQQGGMDLPKNNGARLIVGTWWLVVMVIVATYSGTLVSFLTFPRMADSVLSVFDVVKNKHKLTWSLPAKSYLEEHLMSGKSGSYEGLLGDSIHKSLRHNASNYKYVVSRIKKGKHVMIDWTSSLKMLMRMDNPVTNDGICHFYMGTEALVEEPIALLMPLNSPYLPIVNNELKRMQESGLIGKWAADRAPQKDACWEGAEFSNEGVEHKVDLWDMQGIFFVLFIGTLLSSIFLGWEFYSHRRKIAKERKIIRPFVS